MRHGKRGSKLLSLALSILVARSFVAVETPRMAQTNRHKSPSRATRTAFDLEAGMAQYLEPGLVTVTGRTLKDVRRGTLDANNNLRLISKQTALVDIFETQAHTERLAQTLVKSLRRPWWRALCTSEQALNIFLLNVTLPLIPVNGTEFQHLVTMCYRMRPPQESLRFMLSLEWASQSLLLWPFWYEDAWICSTISFELAIKPTYQLLQQAFFQCCPTREFACNWFLTTSLTRQTVRIGSCWSCLPMLHICTDRSS